MKLMSFSVSNYRSITRAHKIHLHDLTILVGKNNEGKSNIIKALSLSMNIIKRNFISRQSPYYSKYSDSEFGYVWQRDFPVLSQNKKTGSKNTKFELEFELTNEELIDFNRKTSSRLSTPDFIVVIEIGEDNIPKINVLKKGTSKLKKKSRIVNEFITKNLVFNYIPAIRTENQALELIRDTLAQELKVVENNPEYIEAINTINKLQKEPLNDIAGKVKNTLQTFIPSINDVEINIEESFRRASLRRGIELAINDGVLTNIEQKGDGIKSLATLAMLTDRYNTEQSSIIAIDEPEAHLHPGSIRQLNNILLGLVKDNQVIISTHNQLFINKNNIKSNIIVSSGKASPAKSIKEIREVLGVKLSDNMISCKNKLFVEGECDRRIITELCLKNEKIKKALNNSELSIEVLGGASKLSLKLYESANTIFDYYVFLDDDNSGRGAYQESKTNGLIDAKKITFASSPGKRESELEDLIDCDIYLDKLNKSYSTHLTKKTFTSMKKKCSDLIKDAFIKEGKPWDSQMEEEIKTLIADICCEQIKNGNDIFYSYRKEPINSLVKNIETLIDD